MPNLSYKFLLNHINEGCFALDQNMKVLYFNRFSEKLFNKKQEEVIGKHLFKEAFPEAAGSEFEKEYATAIKEKCERNFETYFGKKPYNDWYSVHVLPVDEGIAVFFRVISKLKQMEVDIETAKKTYHSLLEQSEQRYRDLVESAADGIAIQQDHVFVFANQSAAAMLGYKNPGDLFGKPINEIIHPDHVHLAFSRIKNMLGDKKENHPTEEIFVKKDGSQLMVELVSSKIYHQGKPATQIIFRNISERKKVEKQIADSNRAAINLLEDLTREIEERKTTQKALEESEENYRNIFNNVQAGIFRTDLKTGKLILANQRMAEMFGYESVEDALEHFVSEERYVNKEEHKTIDKILTRDGRFYNYETAFYTKTGEVRWFQYSGRLDKDRGYFEGVGIDISDRKKYEQELKQKNTFIQTVLDNLPIGVALNHVDSGQAFYINKKFEEIYGWPKKDLEDIADFFNKVYPNEDYREKIKNQVMTDIQSDKPAAMHWDNIEATTSSGEKRIINAVNIPLMEQNVMVSTVMDITALKNAEIRIREALIKAEESDRLKSAFLANMSHEIRTPMNSIMGFAEVLIDEELSPEKRNHFTNIIFNNSNYLLKLIDDIVDLAKIESNQLSLNNTDFDLHQMLRNTLSVFTTDRRYIEKPDLKLILRNDVSLPLFVNSDETRIRQILNNLLINAIKFTDNGIVEFGYKREKTGISFFVSDSGIGIEKKYLDKIFDRFYQVGDVFSAQRGGTGLGLSISQGLVKLFGGKIKADSKPGKGTTFVFTLPRLNFRQPKKIITPSKDARDISGLSNLHVLVVEDEEYNYLLIKEILKKAGCRVLHASTGNQAIQLIRDHPEINLVMMDIKLPELNGHDATREIKKLRPEIPVIAQTAYAMAGDRKKAIDSGCDDYIAKPIRKKDLLEKIETIISS